VNLALFDFDGTITDSDTFTPFIYLAAGWKRIALCVPLLSPLILAYKLGWLPATRMRAAAAYFCFRGRREDELGALGSRYSSTLLRVVRKEALDKIRWHQRHGDRVVVVSASLQFYLRDWCAEHGLELICTELESRAGVLTGKYAGGDCTGPSKAQRVLSRYDLPTYPIVYAYGDTSEDHDLLRLASKRYFRWQELSTGMLS
jgi:HAD superfamily hydrolase (TIGR01490 family)